MYQSIFSLIFIVFVCVNYVLTCTQLRHYVDTRFSSESLYLNRWCLLDKPISYILLDVRADDVSCNSLEINIIVYLSISIRLLLSDVSILVSAMACLYVSVYGDVCNYSM